METTTQNDIFMFDGKFYKQTDGVVIGFSLGPISSNVFLCHHENVSLERFPIIFKPCAHTTYVDYIFLLFSDLDLKFRVILTIYKESSF